MNITIRHATIHVHNEMDPEVLVTLEAIKTQGATMSQTVDELKAEVAEIEADLSEIQGAVSSALTTITAQAQTIVDLNSAVDALKAGDVLTEQQLADLKTFTDAARDHAEAVAASLRPVTP